MCQKVYVLLLVYNGWEDALECLESVLKSDYDNYQIVVVDNNSPNNSLDHIVAWAEGEETASVDNPMLAELSTPQSKKPLNYTLYNKLQAIQGGRQEEEGVLVNPIVLIQSGENKGFAAGNNVGLKYILSKNDAGHVWLLNNDTVIEQHTLTDLTNAASQYASAGEKVGIIGSKLMFYNAPESIQSVGGVYNKWLATTRNIGAFEADDGQYNNNSVSENIDYPVGASLFVSLAFIRDVGLLCEDYFLYFEELDWAIRGKEKGWCLGYCWKAKVFHKEGGSIGSNSNAKQKSELADYYGLRGKIIFTRKFYKSKLWSVKLGFIFVVFNRLRRGQLSRLGLLVKAMVSS